MGLQIRLTHSLGQRMIELQPRGADQALVIGRAPNADIQVPTANVGRQHCMLYVHEGRWVVFDGGSQYGTFLNGEPVGEPVFLNSGDVISLGGGTNPPTITIDPFGLGSLSVGDPESMGLGAAAAAAPPQVSFATAPAQPTYGGLPQPGTAPQAYAAPGDDENAYDTPATGAESGWENVKPERRYYIPKKKSVSPGLIVGICAGCAVVMVIVMVAVYQTQQKAQAEKKKPAVIFVPADSGSGGGKGSSIFDFGHGGKPQPKKADPATIDKERRNHSGSLAPKVTPNKPATTPPPENIAVAETEEPKQEFNAEKQSPAWQAIEDARHRPGLQVALCAEFLKDMPNSSLRKEVGTIMESALDEIWWKRITDLVDERQGYRDDIKKIKQLIAESQDAEFKKGESDKLPRIDEKIKRIEEYLEEMAYSGDTRPADLSDAQLAALRKKRDATFYEEKWKPMVVEKIRRTRGELPWKSTR